MSKKILFLLPLVFVASSTSTAQVSGSCQAVYANAVTKQSRLVRDFSHNEYVFEKYCNRNGSKKGFSLTSIDEAIVEAIPFKSTLGISGSSEKLSQFCREYAQYMSTQEYVRMSDITPDVAALRSFNDCIVLERQGITLTDKYSPDAPAVATTRIGFDPNSVKVSLSSLSFSDNVKDCTTNDISQDGTATRLTGNRRYDLRRTTLITCRRNSTPDYGGVG